MKRSGLLLVLTIIFLEWLDFSLYLYLAKAVFSIDFFPKSSHSLALAFALFATGYLARPVGGWLFGRAADLNGRRNPMVYSAGLMGLATLGICMLPGFEQIGVVATWALLGLRIAQGLALGGEMNTSAMFLVEHHPRSPLIAGSLAASSGALGMFIGGVLAALIQYQTTPWAWRIVFAGMGGVSLWVCHLRKQLRESPEFNPHPPPAAQNSWKLHWRGMLNIATIGAYVSVTVYLCNVFWLSFAIDRHLWSSVQCAWVGSFAQCASVLFALPIACLAKPAWSSRLLQASMLVISIAAPALFYFTAKNMVGGVLVSLLAYALTNGLICSSLFYFLYQQLPSHYRCRGVSTIWAIAASLGAIALPVAEQVVTAAGVFWFPGMLVTVMALMSFMVIRLNHDNRLRISSAVPGFSSM